MNDCTATIEHGPGHQSTSTCERKGEHKVHAIFEQFPADTKLWVDEQAVHTRYDYGVERWYVFSGVMDESPLEVDEDPALPKQECPNCGRRAITREFDNKFGCHACGKYSEHERGADW